MFIYNYCKVIEDNFYDEKISTDEKDKYITKHDLKKMGNIKEYWLNNVCIIDNDGDKSFKYIKDLSVEFVNDVLVQEIDIRDCKHFNFYESDLEYEYELYENCIKGIKYQIKDYGSFITYSYISENKL